MWGQWRDAIDGGSVESVFSFAINSSEKEWNEGNE